MTNEQIGNFLEPEHLAKDFVKIDFKTRNSITGLFIQTADYDFLKTKNLWRIVSSTNAENWKKTKNESLARIFNGAEITKLKVIEKEKV